MFAQQRLSLSILSSLLIFAALITSTRADIYQWEYINPADPSQGKQPSAVPCLDGVGVTAQPWASLSHKNLQKGYFIGANLQDANLLYANVADADFTGANLQETLLGWAYVENANFSGADVRMADFEGTVAKGFTAAQLYSTASYQSGDLHGIDLGYNNLSGWNFEGQNLFGGGFPNTNLTGANLRNTNIGFNSFYNASIAGADLTGASIQGTSFYQTTGLTAAQLYSTASYQSGNLTEVGFWAQDFTAWKFAGKNLTNTSFYRATLANADFTGATVRNVNFEGAVYRGFTAAQLYSTASYQAGDLRGIQFQGDDNLTGWNFAGQDLSEASFYNCTLTNANFTNAKITGASFSRSYGDQISAAQFYSTATYQQGDLTGIGLGGDNLTGWNFAGKTLTSASFASANLTNANFAGANLVHANFTYANFTNANLTGANLRGADLRQIQGLTAAQLYSTASYQAKDLSDNTLFASNYMNGWNFSQQNLTDASFQSTQLKNSDFSGANLTHAYFAEANLTGANFSQANLTRAYLRGAALTNAVLTGANIQGADLGQAGTGLTAAQFYSTASYQSGDLSGLGLYSNNLSGWNLAAKNLSYAMFNSATLTGANLANADLTGASFGYANLTNANLTGAIIRRAYLYNLSGFTAAQLYSTASYQAHDLFATQWNSNNLSGWNFSGQNLQNAVFGAATITGADFTAADTRGVRQLNPDTPINTNLIRPDGSIHGLQLTGAKTLVVRDYDGDPNNFDAPIPIRVENSFVMDATGALQLQLTDNDWGSLISFAPGITVTLGGKLKLDFAAGVDAAAQYGRTFQIFDWTGVAPTGLFTIDSPYAWNLSHLYTTGEITIGAPDALGGDFNHDETVDAGDYLVWRKHGWSTGDLNTWKSNFGTTAGTGTSDPSSPQIPEPATLALVVVGLVGGCVSRRIRRA